MVFTTVMVESSSPAVKTMAPELQEEFCKNFTYGNPVTKEFFSPGFPRNYPAGIKCFRTISADYGYFVRVDFRDYFNIEPPTNEGNCAYDYLEVREAFKKKKTTKHMENSICRGGGGFRRQGSSRTFFEGS